MYVQDCINRNKTILKRLLIMFGLKVKFKIGNDLENFNGFQFFFAFLGIVKQRHVNVLRTKNPKGCMYSES